MVDIQSQFQALPVFVGSASNAVRYLYLRPHDTGEPSTSGRCIFVNGIPARVTEEEFVRFVMKFGPVHTAALHPSRISSIVVFQDDTGAKAIMKAAKKGRPYIIDTMDRTQAYGLKDWVKRHKALKPGNAVLQRQLDTWMDEYEEREARKKEAALAAMEDDGWTVVQRHKGRKKNTNEVSGVTVGAVAAAAAEEIARKKRPAVHENFYKFQQKAKRRSGKQNMTCVSILFVC